MYEIYVYAKTFLEDNFLGAPSVLCTLASRHVCARTRAQLRGNIALKKTMHIAYSPYFHKIYKLPLYFRFLLNLLVCPPYFDHDCVYAL